MAEAKSRARRPLRERVVVHPFLVAIFPILSFYSTVAVAVPPAHLVLPLSLMTGLTAVIWALFGRLTGSLRRGALVTSFCLVLFWGYRYLLDLGQAWPRAWLFLSTVVVVGTTALLLWISLRAVRSRQEFRQLNAVANLVALTVVVMPLLFMIPGLTRRAAATSRATESSTVVFPTSLEGVPDIYYIVLDAFGRADVLERTYGVKAGLAEELAKMGFFVADRSRANYTTTLHSLASTLNLDFAQGLLADRDPREDPWLALKRTICRSRVRSELATRGYEFISYASGFEATDCPDADRQLRLGWELAEFHAVVLSRVPSMLHRVLRPYFNPYRVHRERILGTLEDLSSLPQGEAAPRFVFAHLLSPHPPFVFGENGEDVSVVGRPLKLNDGGVGGRPHDDPAARQEYLDGYRRQVTFLGRRVAETVTAILDRSDPQPIVIVQGDHGPNSAWPGVDLSERLAILNAYYFPAGAPSALYDSISPVNSFRVLLGHRFGFDLPMLPDDSYRSSYEQVTEFERAPEESSDERD